MRQGDSESSHLPAYRGMHISCLNLSAPASLPAHPPRRLAIHHFWAQKNVADERDVCVLARDNTPPCRGSEIVDPCKNKHPLRDLSFRQFSTWSAWSSHASLDKVKQGHRSGRENRPLCGRSTAAQFRRGRTTDAQVAQDENTRDAAPFRWMRFENPLSAGAREISRLLKEFTVADDDGAAPPSS